MEEKQRVFVATGYDLLHDYSHVVGVFSTQDKVDEFMVKFEQTSHANIVVDITVEVVDMRDNLHIVPLVSPDGEPYKMLSDEVFV